MGKTLPTDFLRSTESLFGTERFARFMDAMDEEPPVSIRVNGGKVDSEKWIVKSEELIVDSSRVPWCPYGFYLPRRPAFTFDPLLHAGCYYVQEAASQFIVHSARSAIHSASCTVNHALDLCAAPGGKSTALRSVLPPECLLVSNEPVRTRAQILSENIQKWGHDNCLVTNNYAGDFVRSGLKELFDLIVCDVPCSGEGMFRKDPASIEEWSTDNVAKCQQLQRQIVSDIWPCLRPGGILIYSTCTYNIKENEENVRWLQEQTGANIIEVPTLPEWGITGSLLPSLNAPIYRFIPGLTRSEGLFMAVLRKPGEATAGSVSQMPKAKVAQALSRLNVLHSSFPPVTLAKTGKGNQRQEAPSCAEALSVNLDLGKYPIVQLPYPTAIAYLRREAIVLPEDTPKGYVVVAFHGHPLGFVKNIGSRANNLYPREWAIKSSHVHTDYEPVSEMLIL